MDRTTAKTNRLERLMYGEIDALYDKLTAPVMKKHRRTLERLQELAEKGLSSEARRLMKTSGFLDDMADALSAAGRESGAIIRRYTRRVREVVADDDAQEA